MPIISVRIPDELAVRFDRAAALAGGRSALLRRLMQTMEVPANGPAPRPPRAIRPVRISIRLTGEDGACVQTEALRMGLRPATWIAALVRRRVLSQPTFTPADAQLLIGVRVEVRRIGVNINQIARALNTAVLEGRVLDAELSSIDDFRRELRAHVDALGEAFAGNLAYWETAL